MISPEQLTSRFRVDGRSALVTGGTSGIGLAIVEMLSCAGARVAVMSNETERCREVAASIEASGGEALSLPCDVSQEREIDAAVRTLLERWGSLDIVVVNAGGAAGEPAGLSINSRGFAATLDVNLGQAVHLTDRLAPPMVAGGGGSIILMSSLSGMRGNRSIGAYSLAKAALVQLARNLAVQWGPANVRVNAISPGLIRTPFTEPIFARENILARRLRQTPLRRAGEAWEVAAAVLFLASEAGSFISGHNLVIDGGTLVDDGQGRGSPLDEQKGS